MAQTGIRTENKEGQPFPDVIERLSFLAIIGKPKLAYTFYYLSNLL